MNDLLPRKRAFDHLDLHVKDVAASVNLSKLRCLLMSADTKKKLKLVLRWVEDINFYHKHVGLPKLQIHKVSGMSAKDFKLLEAFGKFVSISPKCGVISFCVPEWVLQRRRPIFWPDINRGIDRNLLMRGIIPLKATVRSNAQGSRYSAQFDFRSWYDQIGLAREISALFGVSADKCLASLPMGFRPSAEVAQMVSTAIADFELPDGVNVTIYIDNVRFGGPTAEAVFEASKKFVRRAAEVGAQLNSSVIEIQTTEDFLGEHYDLKNKTRSLTRKSVEKLEVAKDLLSQPELSYRQVAAIFGLLYFVSDVLNLPMSKFFKSLSAHRYMMSLVPDSQWDAGAPALAPEVTDELLDWIALAMGNTPAPIVNRDLSVLPPDVTIYVDASAFGWGAVCFSGSSVKYAGGAWSEDDRERFNLNQSTVAEPLAVKKAVLAFVSTNFKHVRIFSDHIGLVFAGNKKYGKSADYNSLCAFIREYFPETDFSFNFIPGAENVLADDISRGRFQFYNHLNRGESVFPGC